MTPPAKPQRPRRNATNAERHLRLVAPDGSAEPDRPRRWRVERATNVTLAVIAIVATLPLWVVIAILIKLTSRGPVFYHQIRIGLDSRSTDQQTADPRRSKDLGGRPFRIYKFRTMTVDADSKSGAVWASRNDPRITMVGRILRQLRLDELPQFINVIRGDMNIVGPRPEQPTLFEELRQQIPGYQLRQRARPGITGHAQVNLEYDSCVDDVRTKLQYDLDYIRHRNMLTDLMIMLKTIPVILFRRGGW